MTKNYLHLFVTILLCNTALLGQAPVAGLGKAIELELARSEGIEINNAPSLQWGQSSFTVEAWIRRPSGTGFFTIAGKQNPAAGTGWFFRLNDNKLSFATLGGVTNWVDGTTAISDNNWHHVAAVMNAVAKTLTIYIDGVAENSSSFTTASNVTNTQKLGVGFKPNYGEYFNGAMDDVRIWTTARSTDEIRAYRNTPLKGTEAGLVMYFTLEEGSGTSITDLSANANTGSLLNADNDEWITGNIAYNRTLDEDAAITLRLGGSETGNQPAVTAVVSQLPMHGTLYQTNDGTTKGVVIVAGTLLTDAGGNPRRLIYEPAADYYGTDQFSYQVNNGTVTSANTETVSLMITPVNDAPVIISNGGGATASVSILNPQQFVTTATATDVDNSVSSLVFSISGGDDAADFTINANTGTLSFVQPTDINAPADANLDNIYLVTISVSDGMSTDEQAITVTVTGTMPVTLVKFEGRREGYSNLLTWTTASETNMKVYEIEKSADGTAFTTTGEVAVKPGSSNEYAFTDAAPFSTTFYRLKMTGNDGSRRYSQVLVLTGVPVKQAVSVFPNPVKGRTVQIRFSEAQKGRYGIALYNATGTAVFHAGIDHPGGPGVTAVKLPASITTGVYIFSIKGTGVAVSYHLIIE